MIVQRKPQDETDLTQADQAWFDSNASDNITAIKEVDAEAAKFGLTRTREYWLQTFTFEGQVVRRGFCYRPEPSSRLQRISERRNLEPQGTSSVDTIRAMREE